VNDNLFNHEGAKKSLIRSTHNLLHFTYFITSCSTYQTKICLAIIW